MKGKKLLVLLGSICLVLALVALPLMAACAKPAPPPEEKPTPTPPAEVTELSFAQIFAPVSNQSIACEEFCQEIEERTNGRVKITYFPGGSLLTADRMLDGVIEGISDIGWCHIGYSEGRFPVTKACMLPLGYPNAWVANHVANDFYREFKPKEWEHVHVLCLHSSPVNIIISNKAVYKLEDLKGMTIRGDGAVADVIEALGATARPLPGPDIYEAMSKHVIDASMTPFETMRLFNLADVSKYAIDCQQVGQAYTFYLIMNKDAWEKLPADIKEVFNECSGEFEEKLAQVWYGVDTAGREYALEKGVEIIELPPEEVARWQEAAKSVIEEYVQAGIAKGYPEEEVRGWISFAQERIEYWSEKQAEFGIE